MIHTTANKIKGSSASGTIYRKGNKYIDDSVRLTTDPNTGITVIEKRTDGVWNKTSIKTGGDSVWVGENVGIAAAGHHIVTEASDGHYHLHAHSKFDGETSVSDATVIDVYNYTERLIVQSDNSGSFTGTNMEFSLTYDQNMLVKKGYFQTGTTAATEQVKVRVWEGTDDTGILIFDQSYPASTFEASSEISSEFDGFIEFETGTSYFTRVSSDADFSLKMNAANTIPWQAIDVSNIHEDNMLQTTEWISGDTFTEGQLTIQDRQIYRCLETGEQTGVFLDNSDKWSQLASEDYVDNAVLAEDFWQRNGTTLSPQNSGDDISTTGDIYGSNGTFTGRVGIGTDSPSGDLHVYNQGVGGSSTILISDDNLALIQLRDEGLGKVWNMEIGRNATSGDLTFYDSSTIRVTFQEGGNVGIGTTDPTSRLDVNGDVTANTFLGELTGTINTATTGITQSSEDNSTLIATTEYVDNAVLVEDFWDRTDTIISPKNVGDNISTTGSITATGGFFYENTVISEEVGIEIEQEGTGDALLNWRLTGTQLWSMGIDNADANDGLAISQGGAVRYMTFSNLSIYTEANIDVNLSDTLYVSAGSDAVGIGTTQINRAKLTIADTQAADLMDGLRIENLSDVAGTAISQVFSVSASRIAKAGFFFVNENLGNGLGDFHICVDGDDDSFSVGVVDARLTIKSAGFVGIGVTDPTTTLAVADVLQIQGGIQPQYPYKSAGLELAYDSNYAGIDTTGACNIQAYDRDASVYKDLYLNANAISFSIAGQDNNAMVIANSGKVGIGTQTPTSELHVTKSGGAGAGILISHSNLALIQLKDEGLNKVWNMEIGRSSTSGDLTFYDNSGIKVTFQEGGNVGIGTTNPDGKLEINGTGATANIKFGGTGGDANYMTAEGDLIIGSNTGIIHFRDSTWDNLATYSPLMSISANGVGIGTETPATSAILELDSEVGALLLTRLTTLGRDALTPSAGMIFFNTDLSKVQSYDGTVWGDLFGSGDLDVKGDLAVQGELGVVGDLGVQGAVSIYTMPTSDPFVAGRLWRNGTDLKISTG